jgi:catechol 2,3-dioxygenase-like lactoylglutathione lyase family enzyme
MPSSIAAIRALRSVELRTTALSASADYYSDVWGLTALDRDGENAWLRGTGENHHVLSLRAAEQNGLGRISFAVTSVAEVDVAGRALLNLGVPLLTEPSRLDQPGGGYGLRFADPEGRLIEISTEVAAVRPLSRDAVAPIGIAHVVLNTVDIDRAVDFYVSVLGLRVSDWSEHQMVFLRCNADHHCIAFNQAGWASVNHVAYELPSYDHFMRGIGQVRHHGGQPIWGPGRHGPGNNTFSYFADPAKLVCEYTSEVAQVDERTWLPRVWRRIPELADLWGTAGPPSKEARSAMAGVPDQGAFGWDPAGIVAMERMSAWSLG